MSRLLSACGPYHMVYTDDAQDAVWTYRDYHYKYTPGTEPERVDIPGSGRVTYVGATYDHHVVVRGGALYMRTSILAPSSTTTFARIETPGDGAVQWVRTSMCAVVVCVGGGDVYARGDIHGIVEDATEWARLDALCGRDLAAVTVTSDSIIFREMRHRFRWWGYGRNKHGTLALGSRRPVRKPVRLHAFEGARIEYVRAYYSTVVAVSFNRRLYVCGSGLMFAGSPLLAEDKYTLRYVHLPGDMRVADVSVRDISIIVVAYDATAWSDGILYVLQLGASAHQRTFPLMQIVGVRGGIAAVHSMTSYFLFATQGGEVYAANHAPHATGQNMVLGNFTRVPALDGAFGCSLPRPTPPTLVELASRVARVRDIEAEATRDVVPPHILAYVRRVGCDKRGARRTRKAPSTGGDQRAAQLRRSRHARRQMHARARELAKKRD